MKRPNHTVLELSIKFKYEWELLDRRDIAAIMRAVNRKAWRGKYGGKVVTILAVTTETSEQLVQRVRPSLDDLTFIETYWCQTAGRDGIGRDGNICPFQTAINAAWEEVQKRNYPKKVSDFRSRNLWIDNRVDYFNRKDAIKMGMNPQRKREPKKGTAG